MSLTFGRSPFGPQRGHYDIAALPEQVAYIEPWPRRTRALFAGRTVLDSRHGMMLHRTGAAPTLLFRLTALAEDVLVRVIPGELCPSTGLTTGQLRPTRPTAGACQPARRP